MKKRILGFLLALCLIVGLLPTIALADDPATPTPITIEILGNNNTSVKWTDVANKTYYATTNADGDVADQGETEPAGGWQIMLDNTGATAVLTLNGANLKAPNGKVGISATGEGALEIRVKKDSTVAFQRSTGIATSMLGGTTYTSEDTPEGKAKLNVTWHTDKGVSCLHEARGLLTLKDANIYAEVFNTSAGATNFAVLADAGLTVDGGILHMFSKAKCGGFGVTGDLTIQNGADVFHHNTGRKEAISVSGNFSIANSNLRIVNAEAVSATYVLSKNPTLTGATAQYKARTTGYEISYAAGFAVAYEKWATIAEDAENPWLDLPADVSGNTALSYIYFKAACAHANAGAQTDCTVAVTCPDCNETAFAAKEHTGGTATCTAKAVCTVCNKEYGELAAHQPKEGTYACSEAHPCANCTGNYREAGTHTPAADDGDCTTAIKCSSCDKEATAAQTAHKYTDNADTTCDNAGCTHTRKVENGGKNPQTGDNTPVVLFVALASLAAAAVIFTKKRAII